MAGEAKALHIAPGYSAGGSLEVAIRDACRDEEVLKWPDDLSCGPIDPGTPEQRDEWWDYGDWDLAGKSRAFCSVSMRRRNDSSSGSGGMMRTNSPSS